MFMPPKDYCGDKPMEEALEKCGSKRTLYEVYGLFYGCIAAPHMVRPSEYLELILGKEEDRKPFESLDDANRTLGHIMSLWNLIASWKPEEDEYFYPHRSYPKTFDGLMQTIQGHLGFMNYFIKGLDLGGLQESDMTGDVKPAFKDLATVSTIQEKLLELLEREKAAKESEIAESRKHVAQLEDVMFHCIARINVGLREARMAVAREMGGQAAMAGAASPFGKARGVKAGRNDPCPCGSGKKYKKCCAGTA